MTTPPAPLNAAEESMWRSLTFLLNHLVRNLDAALLRETGVSVSQYVVLVHLSEAGNSELRIGDLASACNLSASRVSRLIDAMERNGEVTKHDAPNDGRGVVVRLTPHGLATLRRAYPTQLASVRRLVFDQLSTDDVEALSDALGRVRRGIEEPTGGGS